jgi:cytochrome c553
MKSLMFMLLAIIAVCLVFSVAMAEKGGSVEKGKILFDSPSAFGGKKACGECHPNGKGLEKAGSKTRFRIYGKALGSLEEAVNFCIENASKGRAIPQDSEAMQDIVAYIKSLGEPEAPGYDTSGYGSPGYGSPGYGGAPGY